MPVKTPFMVFRFRSQIFSTLDFFLGDLQNAKMRSRFEIQVFKLFESQILVLDGSFQFVVLGIFMSASNVV